MKGGQCELAPLLLWDPVAKAGSKGRNVLAGREGQDDLVAEVWRAAQPKRLIGSLNRDTGASPCGDYPGIAHWCDLSLCCRTVQKKEASRTGRFVVTSVSWQISLTGVN